MGLRITNIEVEDSRIRLERRAKEGNGPVDEVGSGSGDTRVAPDT